MLAISSSLSGANNFILTPTIYEYMIIGVKAALVINELKMRPTPRPSPKPEGSAQ
jgi:CBS-domain-containing membrane protein